MEKLQFVILLIENAKKIRKSVGYLPQDFSIYSSMSVACAMNYLDILSVLNTTQRIQRTENLLKKVNLSQHKNKKVKELSGEMKRRLGITQALLNNPKVLIVDDRTVILSTHIVGDTKATCENIAILNNSEQNKVIEIISKTTRMNKEDILKAKIDDILGGGSSYSADNLIGFGTVPISYEEALYQYNLAVNEDKITGGYVRLFSDYAVTILLSVLPVFLAALKYDLKWIMPSAMVFDPHGSHCPQK